MAGPTVLVKLIGDATNFAKSVDDVVTKATGAASRMSTAFSTALTGLNATGALGPLGIALNGVVQGLDAIAEHGKDAGLVMIGLGAAGVAIGAGLAALGSQQQAALGQLKAALDAAGQNYDDFSAQIDKAVAQGEKFGFSQAKVDDALRIALQGTGDMKDALDAESKAAELAAAKHEDLSTAVTQLTRVSNAAGRLLKEFGLSVYPTMEAATKKVAEATDALTSANDTALSAQQALKSAQDGLVTATNTLTDARTKLADTEQNVHEVLTRSGQAGRDLSSANLAVQQSSESLVSSQQALLDVQQKLYDIQHGTGQYATDAAHAQLALQHANLATTESTNNLVKAQTALKVAQSSGNQQAINDAMLSLAQAQLGVSDATQGQSDAQKNLKDITDQAVPGTKAYVDVHNQLKAAQLGVAQSQNAQVDAQAKLQSLLNQAIPGTKEYRDLMKGLSDAQNAVATAQTQQADAQTKIADAQTKYSDALKKQQEAVQKVSDAGGLMVLAQQGNMAVVDALGDKLAGQAEAQANTFSGAMKRIQAEITNTLSTFGSKYGTLIIGISSAFIAIGSIITIVQVAWPIIGAVIGAILSPIGLVVLAIVAIIAIIYVLYRNWDTVWGFIKRIINDVWTWIKDNWEKVLDFLFTPIHIAAGLIQGAFEDVKGWVTDAVKWITDRFDDVVDFFTKLPQRLASVGSTMWDWMKDAFKDVINFVIGIWNDFAKVFQVNVHIPIPFSKGVNFDSGQILPSITPFAQGGLVTSPTLALLGEAGPELVTPLGPGGRPGPALYIENAQFNDPVDVELLTKKIAFALQAGLPV